MIKFANDYIRGIIFVSLQILKKPASITAAGISSTKEFILDRTKHKESLLTE